MSVIYIDTAESSGRFDMKSHDPVLWHSGSMVRLTFLLADPEGKTLAESCCLIRLPSGDVVERGAEEFHGISDRLLGERGVSLENALAEFGVALSEARTMVAHSWIYRRKVLGKAYAVLGLALKREWPPAFDVLTEGVAYVGIERKAPGGGHVFPKFNDLYEKVMGRPWQITSDPVHDGLQRVRMLQMAHGILTR